MNIAWFTRGAVSEDEEMARAQKSRPAEINAALAAAYASRLKSAQTDKATFEPLVAEIERDARVKTPEIVAIAKAYAGASKKLGSRAAALDAIRKRFVELVRFDAKNELAAKSRPW